MEDHAEGRDELASCLRPTWFLDFESEEVRTFTSLSTVGAGSETERAVLLYYAVRDRIRYDPYVFEMNREAFKASAVLKAGRGFCVQKAILLAAAARAAGIPSRLGFADVKNHLSTKKLRERMGTDVFVYHGYTELYLGGRWLKATPAFNRSLCERFGVVPLEFDGKQDSIFQPFDLQGNRHMEYLRFHGTFEDFPYERMIEALAAAYPRFFEEGAAPPRGDFEGEIEG